MVWIRLLEDGVPISGVTADLEFSSPPTVGDRIVIRRDEAEMIVLEVRARTFDFDVDEKGNMVSDERLTLDVDRLQFVLDEEDLTCEQRH